MTKKMISLPVPSAPVNRFNPSTMFQESSAAPTLAGVPSMFAMHELLPHNQTLVRFIQQHQPISLKRLFDVYPDAGTCLESFGKRITYLTGKRWVLRAGKGRDAVLTFNADRATPATVARQKTAQPASDLSRQVVAPRRVNVMAGNYQPYPPQAQRLGSDDHLRLPSLRNGQRIPYTPGYIFY